MYKSGILRLGCCTSRPLRKGLGRHCPDRRSSLYPPTVFAIIFRRARSRAVFSGAIAIAASERGRRRSGELSFFNHLVAAMSLRRRTWNTQDEQKIHGSLLFADHRETPWQNFRYNLRGFPVRLTFRSPAPPPPVHSPLPQLPPRRSAGYRRFG